MARVKKSFRIEKVSTAGKERDVRPLNRPLLLLSQNAFLERVPVFIPETHFRNLISLCFVW